MLCWTPPSVCLPCVYLMAPHVTRSPRPSTAVFHTGSDKILVVGTLGTRLLAIASLYTPNNVVAYPVTNNSKCSSNKPAPAPTTAVWRRAPTVAAADHVGRRSPSRIAAAGSWPAGRWKQTDLHCIYRTDHSDTHTMYQSTLTCTEANTNFRMCN